MAAPKQTDPQFKLRLTPEIKARIERAANESGRSMNAEILYRLEQSLTSDPKPPSPEAAEIAAEVVRRLTLKDIAILAERAKKRGDSSGS